MMDWLPWAPLVAASLHMSEEFLIPGGFLGWYRGYRTDSSRITRRFLVIVNAALLVVCCNIALLGRTPLGIAYWLTISALLCRRNRSTAIRWCASTSRWKQPARAIHGSTSITRSRRLTGPTQSRR